MTAAAAHTTPIKATRQSPTACSSVRCNAGKTRGSVGPVARLRNQNRANSVPTIQENPALSNTAEPSCSSEAADITSP